VLGMCDAPRIVWDTEPECDANYWDSSSNNEDPAASKEDEKRSEILTPNEGPSRQNRC
jgi:hypothetical protein